MSPSGRPRAILCRRSAVGRPPRWVSRAELSPARESGSRRCCRCGPWCRTRASLCRLCLCGRVSACRTCARRRAARGLNRDLPICLLRRSGTPCARDAWPIHGSVSRISPRNGGGGRPCRAARTAWDRRDGLCRRPRARLGGSPPPDIRAGIRRRRKCCDGDVAYADIRCRCRPRCIVRPCRTARRRLSSRRFRRRFRCLRRPDRSTTRRIPPRRICRPTRCGPIADGPDRPDSRACLSPRATPRG